MSFWDTNIGKTVKVAGWASLSAAIAALISSTTNDPELFGPYTVLINTVLVYIQKTWFDAKTPNVGA